MAQTTLPADALFPARPITNVESTDLSGRKWEGLIPANVADELRDQRSELVALRGGLSLVESNGQRSEHTLDNVSGKLDVTFYLVLALCVATLGLVGWNFALTRRLRRS